MNAQQKRFVIYCTPRSGSYLLVEYLNQFSGIKCYGEIFKHHNLELSGDEKKINFTLEKRDKQPFKYINSICDLNPDQIVGFKIFPAHNKKVVERTPNFSDFKIIVLRRNIIDVFISLTYAKKSKQWINRGSRDKDLTKITFDSIHFKKYKFKTYKYYKQLNTAVASDQKFNIDYHEVVNIDKVHELAVFLGIDDANITLKTTMKKQIKDYGLILHNAEEAYTYLHENYSQLLKDSDFGKSFKK